MKVKTVRTYENTLQCDITTTTGNFYIVGERSHYLVHNSPAVIFGWVDKNTFVLTDKAGIGAKKYDGRPASAEDVQAMIFNRKPEQMGRGDYAAKFGQLYELLKRATPVKLVGAMMQGDMLWMQNDDITVDDANVNFKMNKIPYHVDKTSAIGKQIAKSIAGVAIHGKYDSIDAAGDKEAEPTPTSPAQLGIKSVPGLFVVGPETAISSDVAIKMPKSEIDKVQALINSPAGARIDKMLDPFTIGALKISNMPDIFKSFINHRAGRGEGIINVPNMYNEFLAWLEGSSNLSEPKQENVKKHVAEFKDAFDTAWAIAAGLTTIKHKIKAQLDKAVSGQEGAIQTAAGHEGFVSATPHGKIKLVNRPEFMKKELK